MDRLSCGMIFLCDVKSLLIIADFNAIMISDDNLYIGG